MVGKDTGDWGCGVKRVGGGGAAFVHSLIWLMVVRALAGKQMRFCETDHFFYHPPPQSLQAARGRKVHFQYVGRGEAGRVDVDTPGATTPATFSAEAHLLGADLDWTRFAAPGSSITPPPE